MRLCNQDDKKEKIGGVFNERNLDVLALSKTKLKSKAVEWLRNILGINSGNSERTIVKKGVAFLFRNELWDYFKECREVKLSLIWYRMKVDEERLVRISTYIRGSERNKEE